MALDSLTVGASSQGLPWGGAPSASALGPDADILAFLQAMIDANMSADADVVAGDAAAPAESGATTGTAGTSPVRAVVPPWGDATTARLTGSRLTQLMRSLRAGEPTTPNAANAATQTDTPDPKIAIARSTSVAERFARMKHASASVETSESRKSSATDRDDDDAAAAFLVMAATQNAVVETHTSETPAETAGDVNSKKDDEAPEGASVVATSADDASTAARDAALISAPVPVMTEIIHSSPTTTPAEQPTSDIARVDTAQQDGGRLPAAAANAGTPPRAAEVRTGNRATDDADLQGETPQFAIDAKNGDASMSAQSNADAVGANAGADTGKSSDANVSARGTVSVPTDDISSDDMQARTLDVPASSKPTAVSPRAQAFLRAMEQGRGTAAPKIEHLDEPTRALDTNGSTAPAEPSTERARWASAAASAAATQAAADPRHSRAGIQQLAAADPIAIRSQLATAVAMSRLVDNSLSSGSGRRQGGDGDSSLLAPKSHILAFSRHDSAVATGATFSVDTDAPASVADVVETPAMTHSLPNEEATAASIVRSMQWQYKNGVGSATVQLDPGYLGDVRVALHVENGSVSATLHAANPEVRAWMQANEGALRQSLAAQGLSLDRLVVAEDDALDQHADQDGRRQPEQEPDRQRPRRAPQRDSEGRTFEIVV